MRAWVQRACVTALVLALTASCVPVERFVTPTAPVPTGGTPAALPPTGQPPESPAAAPVAQPASTPLALPPATPAPTEGSRLTIRLVPPSPAPLTLTLSMPRAGDTVTAPVQVGGRTNTTPAGATLLGRVYDAQGIVIGQAPIRVTGDVGHPGDFAGAIPLPAELTGPVRVEVAAVAAEDGQVPISVATSVIVRAAQVSGSIEVPAEGARVTMPLHFLARIGVPGEKAMVAVRWQNGVQLAEEFTVLSGEDGHGLLVGSLAWNTESQPPQPAEHPAALEIRDAGGAILAQRAIEVLRWDDPETMVVDVYWDSENDVRMAQQCIVRTPRAAMSALQELLWGPPPHNPAGFSTALPLPEEILGYLARQPDWGPRVRLLSIVIQNGVATADFSKELRASAGDPARARLIAEQVTQTLEQFSAVSAVRITIEGQIASFLQP